MELKDGRVLIALRPDLAPKNVARIKELTRKNFYNGLVFHRVIPAFIAQGGDPKGDGSGGTGVSLDAEFSNEPHVRGVVSMARKPDDVNSADSQFFIVIGEAAPQLDGQYTVIGKVVEGMDHVMRIRKGSRALNGSVHNPDKIIKMTVLADEQKTGTVKK
ncbi:MAG: peptidylprolyl isomerase [Alphaproteobacteria bacterium]